MNQPKMTDPMTHCTINHCPVPVYYFCGYVWVYERLREENWEGRKEMFYLMTHSTHFIYGYIASDIW